MYHPLSDSFTSRMWRNHVRWSLWETAIRWFFVITWLAIVNIVWVSTRSHATCNKLKVLATVSNRIIVFLIFNLTSQTSCIIDAFYAILLNLLSNKNIDTQVYSSLITRYYRKLKRMWRKKVLRCELNSEYLRIYAKFQVTTMHENVTRKNNKYNYLILWNATCNKNW